MAATSTIRAPLLSARGRRSRCPDSRAPGRGRSAAGLAIAAAAVLAALATAAPAGALIRAAVTIDGPSSSILSLGGVAMAPDGTGGVVYLKLAGGTPHVFVSRYTGNSWNRPIQVDKSLPYASSWPVIGAADGGRLVVVWAQTFAQDANGVFYRRMYSASLEPGAASFGAPISFDENLHSPNATGDEAVSQLYPSLAMDPGGRAYLVYRVVTDSCANGCNSGIGGTFYRPGDSFASFRLARFNGETWSVLGDINRNPAFSVRPGTAGNSPQIVIDGKGHGVVAFQEPDNTDYDRIWARRLFGSSIGHILTVSDPTILGASVDGDADAFTLAGATSGAAAVAYRQQTAPGSVLTTPRILEASMTAPSPTMGGADQFATAGLIDGGSTDLGVPSIAIAEPGPFDALFAGGGMIQSALGDATGVAGPTIPAPLPLGAVAGADRPGITIGTDGSIVRAWSATDEAARPQVDVDQSVMQTVDNLPNVTDVRGSVAAAVGGPIQNLRLAGDTVGDALVAFQQGQGANGQIAATVVQSVPQPFTAFAPSLFVHPRSAVLTWGRSDDGFGSVSYTVTINGVVRARGLEQRRYRVDPRGLQTGVYQVVILAVDSAGQTRLSAGVELKIDVTPPRVSLSRHGRSATVTVDDGSLVSNSGVDPVASTYSFDDGARSRRQQSFDIGNGPAPASATHLYRRPGDYTIVVQGVDAAGNRHIVNYPIRVR